MTRRSADGTNDMLLFTPGPLTTSSTVKTAMLRDVGSRDAGFIEMIRDIRRQLVALAGVSEDTHTAVIMQGSGTFGIESVLSSTLPPDARLLVVVNGAYGRRIVTMARMLHIGTVVMEVPENQTPEPDDIDEILASDDTITHVSIVHCETTTGIINPVAEIGEIVRRHRRTYVVDAMSSFGAVPLRVDEAHIDFLVSSANKCIEGVPGFSFVVARIDALTAAGGYARSLSLDLLAQYEGLEATGQFRFTPPTHSLRAFRQALVELDHEGGVQGRAARYRSNHAALVSGMRRMGFTEYLHPKDQGYIITSFRYPDHENFRFEDFYERLRAREFVIYPGKVSDSDCFRIGTIGRIFPGDVKRILAAVGDVLTEMDVQLTNTPAGSTNHIKEHS